MPQGLEVHHSMTNVYIRCDLSSGVVYLLNGLDGIQVMDSRIKKFVHHCDSSLLGFLLQLKHGRRDVTCCDNILLVSYGRLDDGRVESVRNQSNDQVVFCNFSIESLSSVTSREMGLAFLTPSEASLYF